MGYIVRLKKYQFPLKRYESSRLRFSQVISSELELTN